ncbi:DUF2484 family protein [Roseovarius salinarum]|uniref:DUF2484 family protein n=1 Tax=Roseovarius salinarum TaxID=1981892 RepID=UPI000C328033|nr:DUF2484 family protein [Roseovarius salinarum]
MAVVLACLWVLAGVGVAMLPVRWQIAPGLALLAAAPVLVWRLGHEAGMLAAALAALAVLSMFRKPLRHGLKRAVARARGVCR